ncbi:hypothetical protein ITP53_39300 [Nonomuraea sp. K274]|uniref:Uncharacterized protein n=1 Tax=Nonomuraea cypriaca TaxID=1187855 RepID=A0A931AEZ0_9ACTN|nr:hypothetical protein [Nonomuraea cypriaca]MBF8191641.1 hypothetical protein [Nonomuraea cypriaca]
MAHTSLPRIAECTVIPGTDGRFHVVHNAGGTATTDTYMGAVVEGMRLRMLAFYVRLPAVTYVHDLTPGYLVLEHAGAFAATWLGGLSGSEVNQLRGSAEEAGADVDVLFSDRLMRDANGELLWTFTLTSSSRAKIAAACEAWADMAAWALKGEPRP